MVKVHVWLQHGDNVGHAALSIGDVYVSFWPDGEAGKKDLKIKRSHPGTFMEDLHQDIAREGNRAPTTIILSGLDEDKMLDYVDQITRDVPRYQLAWNNCSHVVVNCLIAGAGRKPSFVPDARRYSQLGRILGRGIWTPDQVLRFAQELKNG